MLQLLKYEFRKTRFSKLILLALTAVSEAALLVGIFLPAEDWVDNSLIGIIGVALCAVIGIFYIGAESLLVFYRDLNTKQSYMLFLTPRNSFQILGAKTLENGISILGTGFCFAALAFLDVSVMSLKEGGVKVLMDNLQWILESLSIQVDVPSILLYFLMILVGWLLMVVTGFLAITLSATVLAGKRLSGMVSFLLFLAIDWAAERLLNLLPELGSLAAYCWMVIGAALALCAVLYAVTGWIMERKLSV